MSKRLIFSLLLLLAVLSLRAQNAQPIKSAYWLNPQLGTGTYEVSVAAEVGMLLKAKYLIALKLATDANVGEYRNGWHDATTVAGLFGGKLTSGKAVYLTAAAGLGLVRFETRGDAINVQGTTAYGPSKTFTKPGLPAEIKLWVNPWRIVGLTLGAGATFNREQTFGLATLGICVGRLR